MRSNRRDRLPHARRSVTTRRALFGALLAIMVTFGWSAAAGAQDVPPPSEPAAPSTSLSIPPLRPPTTLTVDEPQIQGSDCGPGHIVRPPYCGQEPKSRDDPGGWLQVSLFFIVCGVVIAMCLFVWWRSRVMRRERAAAGLDPVSVARRSGEGLRPGERPDSADAP